MSRVTAFAKRFFWRLRRIALFLLIALALSALPANYAIEYTTTPRFCNSCHIMEPYYKAWERSTHKSVRCVECHYPPGLKDTVWTKFQALTQVAKYVTGTAGTKPWAHVDDSSCMRSGCHSVEAIKVPATFGKSKFDHRPHLEASRPGKEVRCTTCHSQTRREEHMSLNTTACFLCHLKSEPGTTSVGTCTTCHALPATVVEGPGISFDHGTAADRGMSCADCHATVTTRGGEVTRERCTVCHTGSAELLAFDRAVGSREESDALHSAHVRKSSVDCVACHAEIKHGRGHARTLLAGDCKRCHGEEHSGTLEYLKGTARSDEKPVASLMSTIGLSCEACHGRMHAGPGEGAPGCLSCHKASVGRMLQSWRKSFARWDEALEKNAAAVEAAVALAAAPEAKGLLEHARSRLATVKKSRGAHNILYTEALYRNAESDLEAAAKSSGAAVALDDPGLPKAAAKPACDACHLEPAAIEGDFEGIRFPHGVHVLKANLDCETCHASAPKHGQLQITKTLCAECHHELEEGDCSKCHSPVSAFLQGTCGRGVEKKPDPMAERVPCVACHAKRGDKDARDVVRKTCVDCHDAKYGPMLDQELAEEKDRLATLEKPVSALRLAVVEADRASKGYAEARRLLDDAEENVRVLRTARSIHNPEFGKALAKRTLEMVEGARALLRRAP